MFKPRLSIVTGGGAGLGAAMARELAARGSRVIIIDTNLEEALEVKRQIGDSCVVARLDVSDEQQVLAFFQNQGGDIPDCLVNCAGVNLYGEALHVPLADWLRVLSVNLTGTISTTLAAYALMAKQQRGTIINIGSMAVFLIDPLFGAYTTSKFGVVGFSRALAVEARAYGVRVHVVCPGNIATSMRGDRYQLSRFTPAMEVTAAVKAILRGVERRQQMIVFPFHTRLTWWLDRMNPILLAPIRNEIFRRARRRMNMGP